MPLSPLAHLLWQRHRAKPDQPMYDLAVFGPKVRWTGLDRADLERLAAAYEELEAAGLVERTDEVARFRHDFFYLYQPTSKALSDVEVIR